MDTEGTIAIIFFSLIFLFIVVVAFYFLKRGKKFGFKRIVDTHYLEVENTEMLNKLLKRKLEKEEDLTTEELLIIKDLEEKKST